MTNQEFEAATIGEAHTPTPLQLAVADIEKLSISRAPERRIGSSHDGARPFVVAPSDYVAHSLEAYLPKPPRIREKRHLLDPDSFIRYYNRFATPTSVIFASHHSDGTIRAEFDYHGDASDPQWREHSAFYECPRTDEWRAWVRINDSWLSQADFAEFIEDHLLDIYEPKGAQMLEIAKRMQATKNIHFTSGISLQSGDIDFEFRETTQATADQPGKKDKFTLPEEITLGLSVFEGFAPYQVKAKFRYRINDGQLKMKIVLHRPDLVIKKAFDEVLQKITEGTEATVYRVP